MNEVYYGSVRKELLQMIPKDLRRGKLLEIGAGSGATLRYAKRNGYAKYVVGIDIVDLDQKNGELDEFFICDIESCRLDFQDEEFDVVICADVLEHLINPAATLLKIHAKIQENGVVVASIPNICHYSILKKLIVEKDFCYEESGILDKTHLRFFCKKNIVALFENAGYHVDQCVSNQLFNNVRPKVAFFNKLTFGLLEEYLTKQYFIVARPLK